MGYSDLHIPHNLLVILPSPLETDEAQVDLPPSVPLAIVMQNNYFAKARNTTSSTIQRFKDSLAKKVYT